MADRTSADALWRAALDLNRAAAAVDPRAARLPPLIFLTDPARTPEPWRVAARLPAGAAVIHRGFGRAEAADEAARLREATARAGVLLLIALDVDLARATDADGLHLPQRARDRAGSVRMTHPDWFITAAHHADASVPPAGLDAILASPVFPAGGVSASNRPLGADGLRETVGLAGLPTYALGGVDAAHASALTGTGTCGIAAVDAVLNAWGD